MSLPADPLSDTNAEGFRTAAALHLKENTGKKKRFSSQEAYEANIRNICDNFNAKRLADEKSPSDKKKPSKEMKPSKWPAIDAKNIIQGDTLSPWEATVLAAAVGMAGANYLEGMKQHGLALPPPEARMAIDEIVDDVLGDRAGIDRDTIPRKDPARKGDNGDQEHERLTPTSHVDASEDSQLIECKRTLCKLFFGDADRFATRKSRGASLSNFASEVGSNEATIHALMSQGSQQPLNMSPCQHDKLAQWLESETRPQEDKDLFEDTWKRMQRSVDWKPRGVRRSAQGEEIGHAG